MANLVLRKITTPDGTVMFNYNKYAFSSHRDTVLNHPIFFSGNEIQNKEQVGENMTAITVTDILDTDTFSVVRENLYIGNVSDMLRPAIKTIPLKDLTKEFLQDFVEKKAEIFNVDTWVVTLIQQELALRS